MIIRLSGDMEPGERLHIVREMERSVKVEFDKNIFLLSSFRFVFSGIQITASGVVSSQDRSGAPESK